MFYSSGITVLNPLKPNISMHILHTALHTFPKMLTRRICFTINNFFGWWSLPLFLWPKFLSQGWYFKEKIDACHSKGFKGLLIREKGFCFIVNFCLLMKLLHVNPLIPMSDQDRISLYNIITISTRQVMRIKKAINLGIISWSTTIIRIIHGLQLGELQIWSGS